MGTDNKIVAIAMEKIVLTEAKILLRPLKPIMGFLDESRDVVVTDEKEEYYGVYTSISSNCEMSHCFYADVPLFELVNKYDIKEAQEAIFNFYDEICSSLHIGTTYGDGSFEIVDVPLDNLEGVLSEWTTLSQKDGELSVELSAKDIDKLLVSTSIEEIKTILNKYKEYLLALESTKTQNANGEVSNSISNSECRLLVAHVGDNLSRYGGIDVGALYNNVTASVKAQDSPIEDIVTTIASNYMSSDNRNRSHILLTGPTGTGKTEILECISKYIDVPMAKYDMTQVSVTGYVGKNVEDILVRLYLQANQNISVAERGILALDEIDKKASDKNDDVSGRGVLNSLLKLLDGTVFDLELERGGRKIPFDTSHLTVVGMGAFANMIKQKSNPLGFSINKETKDTMNGFDIEDYVKFGIPAELMGRFTTLVSLNALSLDDLKDILLTSSISPLLIKKDFFKDRGITLQYTDAYIEAVAKRALALKTGARSLKATVETSIKKAEFQILRDRIYKELVLDGVTVTDNRAYVLK